MTRPATYEGLGGRAWIVDPRKEDPREAVHVAGWLIEAPASHPVWPWKLLYCVALRTMEGVDPPKLHRSGVTHEIGLVALHREGVSDFAALLDAFETGADHFPFLTPVDACRQFTARSDAEAAQVAHAIARAFVEGRLVPDEDYRSAIHGAIDGTAACVAAGTHEPS